METRNSKTTIKRVAVAAAMMAACAIGVQANTITNRPSLTLPVGGNEDSLVDDNKANSLNSSFLTLNSKIRLVPTGGKLMITAGDEGDGRLVLGWTDMPRDGQVPPPMQEWLKMLDREISLAMKQGKGLRTKDERDKSRRRSSGAWPDRVEPLMQGYLWSQDAPYNDSVPEGCPAGCVAVNMGMVMDYHRWPQDGRFDWDAILPSYSTASTTESRAAVAHLLKDVGRSVGMAYAPGGSGAQEHSAALAMTRTYGYTSDQVLAERAYFGHEEWDDLLRREISEGRPVPYFGGFHAFVVDGYDADGYFHFNWGWGGQCNGWFLSHATSMNNNGWLVNYNFMQTALLGMDKPDGQADGLWLFTADDIAPTTPETALGGTMEATVKSLTNEKTQDFSLRLGLRLFNDQGEAVGEAQYGDGRDILFHRDEDIAVPYKLPADLPDGGYELRAVARPEGTAEDISVRTGIGGQKALRINVEDGKAKAVQQSYGKAALRVKGMTYTTPYVNFSTRVRAVAVNDGDDISGLSVYLIVTDEDGKTADYTHEIPAIDIAHGDSVILVYDLEGDIRRGEGFYNLSLRYFSSQSDIDLATAQGPKVWFKEYHGQDKVMITKQIQPLEYDMPADPVQAGVTLRNEGDDDFNHNLEMLVVNAEQDVVEATITRFVQLRAGEERRIVISGTIPNAAPGTLYRLMLRDPWRTDGTHQWGDYAWFRLSDGTAGIRDAQTDSMDDGYYNLQGMKMKKPRKGIYIYKGKKVFKGERVKR